MSTIRTLGAFALTVLAAATVVSLTLLAAAATVGVALHAAGTPLLA